MSRADSRVMSAAQQIWHCSTYLSTSSFILNPRASESLQHQLCGGWSQRHGLHAFEPPNSKITINYWFKERPGYRYCWEIMALIDKLWMWSSCWKPVSGDWDHRGGACYILGQRHYLPNRRYYTLTEPAASSLVSESSQLSAFLRLRRLPQHSLRRESLCYRRSSFSRLSNGWGFRMLWM